MLSISWLIKGGISRVTILITHIRGLITLLITTHEPPSQVCSPISPFRKRLHGYYLGPANSGHRTIFVLHNSKIPCI